MRTSRHMNLVAALIVSMSLTPSCAVKGNHVEDALLLCRSTCEESYLVIEDTCYCQTEKENIRERE